MCCSQYQISDDGHQISDDGLWFIIGKDKMVLEGKISVPFCLKALIYAGISAFLGFKEAKILLPTKLLRT